ncbi:hypothetical protein DFR29_11358 [Tahibacter aquaticus]|uniref:BNR/Asp-box repeat protein n=1 Tax=Tahibacter aquaticus TaxID=520092 RepID=A0A4R6YQY7_9GAMM|nr:hypothetical protein [Tahibacter aquaticus]TDR40358.1 hypothetical protein DFR29_11358 [Tahibacter aquaticus]
MYRSLDGGVTWSSIAIGDGACCVTDIRFFGGCKVVAIVDERLYVSADSGQTWTQRGGGVFRHMSLAAVPADPPQQIAANATSCWRSTDFFSTVQNCGGGLVAAGRPPATLAIARHSLGGYSVMQPHGRDGVRRVHQNAVNGYAENTGMPAEHLRGLALHPPDPQVLYTGRWVGKNNHDPLLRSIDGDSWTALHAQLPVGAVWDLRIAPADQRRLHIAGSHGVWTTLSPPDRIFEDSGL